MIQKESNTFPCQWSIFLFRYDLSSRTLCFPVGFLYLTIFYKVRWRGQLTILRLWISWAIKKWFIGGCTEKKQILYKRKQEWYCWWKTSCMGCITPCRWWIIDYNRMKGLPTVSTGCGTSAINNTINNYRMDRTCCFFGFVSTLNDKKTDLYGARGTEWLREFSWILGSSVFPPKMIFCQKKRSTPWRVSAMVEKVSAQKKKANEKNMCCLSLQHLCWNPAPIARYGSALNCLSFLLFHVISYNSRVENAPWSSGWTKSLRGNFLLPSGMVILHWKNATNQ